MGIDLDLAGRVAVVTGGSRGIGRATCLALAAHGARVGVHYFRSGALAEEVAREIRSGGGEAVTLPGNLLEPEAAGRVIAGAEKALGPVDILINGAGGNHPKGTTSLEYLRKEDLAGTAKELVTFYDLDPKGIEFVFNLNFLGTFLPTQVFSKDMVAKGRGNIINISSMNAFRPLTKIPAYSAAKAGVSNFTQWLAVHFSKVGVRVNALAPGFFLTDQNRSLLTQPDGSLTAAATPRSAASGTT